MIKFDSCATISVEIQVGVDRFPVAEHPKRWDGKAKAVVAFKKEIMRQGLEIQGHRCAWCTLEVGEKGRRSAHRDHIAPKGIHPEWTFNAKNLVISCEYCNGFLVKGDIDTVEVVNNVYENCEFWVVHPYLDEVVEHISFRRADGASDILVQSHSEKGKWTINVFRLDTPEATVLRAKDYLHAEHLVGLTVQDKELLKSAVSNLGKG